MDDDSGESAVEDEVAGVGRDESDWEWLVRGCRREAGSWFQWRGEAYWKERSVIRKEEDVGDVMFFSCLVKSRVKYSSVSFLCILGYFQSHSTVVTDFWSLCSQAHQGYWSLQCNSKTPSFSPIGLLQLSEFGFSTVTVKTKSFEKQWMKYPFPVKNLWCKISWQIFAVTWQSKNVTMQL